MISKTTNYYEIVAALIVALVLTLFFSKVLRSKGPWGALWLVFVIIFLTTWAGHLWIDPFGPSIMGVYVAPLFVVGLIFAFILAAVTLPASRPKTTGDEVVTAAEDTTAAAAIGIFFWVLLIILLIAIATGYYRMPVNSEQLLTNP